MTGETRTSFELSAPVRAAHKTVAVAPALIAITLGVFILIGSGFAQVDALHNSGFAQLDALYNAAHDARHAFGFPCH